MMLTAHDHAPSPIAQTGSTASPSVSKLSTYSRVAFCTLCLVTLATPRPTIPPKVLSPEGIGQTLTCAA